MPKKDDDPMLKLPSMISNLKHGVDDPMIRASPSFNLILCSL